MFSRVRPDGGFCVYGRAGAPWQVVESADADSRGESRGVRRTRHLPVRLGEGSVEAVHDHGVELLRPGQVPGRRRAPDRCVRGGAGTGYGASHIPIRSGAWTATPHPPCRGPGTTSTFRNPLRPTPAPVFSAFIAVSFLACVCSVEAMRITADRARRARSRSTASRRRGSARR